MLLNAFAVSGLLSLVTSAAMAVIMLIRARKRIPRMWGVFCLTVMMWGLGVFNIATTDNQESALYWWQIAYIGVIFIPVLFTHFVHAFLNIKRPFLIAILYLFGTGYLAANIFTDNFIRDVHFMFEQLYYLSPTPLYNSFVVFFGLTIIYSHLLLYRAYRQSGGKKKVQIEYFFAGSFLGFWGGSFSFLPVYRINLYPYLNLTVFLYPLIMSYAIILHRLMDIRMAVRRVVQYTFLSAFSYALFYTIAGFYQQAWGSVFAQQGYLVGIFVSVAFAILLPRLYRLVQLLANRFLYAGMYNSQKTFADLSQELTTIIDLPRLVALITETITETLGVADTRIILRELGQFDRESTLPNFAEIIQDSKNPLTQWLKRNNRPLVLEELIALTEDTTNLTHRQQLTAIKKVMQWIKASVCVPLMAHDELIGIIAIGQKRNNEAFSREDVELLRTVASSAATALENARLYQESLEFGEKLKLEVERATHELAQANTQLRDLDKAKSEFLSIASHQLYTPLTALRGYLSMLQEGEYGKTSPKQAPVLDILEKSATRLIDLIKNLLDISRIESGRLELNLEEIDLVEISHELVQDLLPNAMNKNLDLVFSEPQDQIPPVIADRERIRQVVLNFIDNAIKYTEEGNVTVSVGKEGDEIVFSVTDTGKGLSRDEIAKLFNKFTRVGGASRFHTEGTGLGLYVARQIVKEHRGDVEVTSPGTGQGSTFAMRLPRAGSARSLKAGANASVIIKAAEVKGKPD